MKHRTSIKLRVRRCKTGRERGVAVVFESSLTNERAMDDGVREDYGLVIGELEGRKDGEGGDAISGNNEQDDTPDCTQETRVSK